MPSKCVPCFEIVYSRERKTRLKNIFRQQDRLWLSHVYKPRLRMVKRFYTMRSGEVKININHTEFTFPVNVRKDGRIDNMNSAECFVMISASLFYQASFACLQIFPATQCSSFVK